ncbi:MAG: RNA polymerase sigma factor [Bacteroidia bacterium]|nr:RNA polymerase sigma factor [Bacteroidia bacterium]
MQDDLQLIEACKKRERFAQKVLYETYAPLMRAICLRYSGAMSDAEDLMHEGFIKVFTNIKQYSGKGSFEGWMKRIFINLSITYFHKKQKHSHFQSLDEVKEINLQNAVTDENEEPGTGVKSVIMSTEFSVDEIQKAVNELPDGYRMVFNLYVFENYSHKEIADLLKIKENTSKSQLARARKSLQQKLYELAIIKMKNADHLKDGKSFLKLVI